MNTGCPQALARQRMRRAHERLWTTLRYCSSTTAFCSRRRVSPTDCSGDHDVMASQVRPWSIQPDSSLALQARPTDEASISEFHQGQRHRLDQSPNVRLQSLPFEPSPIECLANPGATMYRALGDADARRLERDAARASRPSAASTARGAAKRWTRWKKIPRTVNATFRVYWICTAPASALPGLPRLPALRGQCPRPNHLRRVAGWWLQLALRHPHLSSKIAFCSLLGRFPCVLPGSSCQRSKRRLPTRKSSVTSSCCAPA